MIRRLLAISVTLSALACDVPPEDDLVEMKTAALAAGDDRTEWKKCYDNCEHIFFVCSADNVLPYDSCQHEFGVCMRGCDRRFPERQGGGGPQAGGSPGVLQPPVLAEPIAAPKAQSFAP